MYVITTLLLATILLILRLSLIDFKGMTIKYWGDFEFIVLLYALNMFFYKFDTVAFLKFSSVCFVVREIIRKLATRKTKDLSANAQPQDVVITFKRCKECSSPYDYTQHIGFFVGMLFLIHNTVRIKSMFQ